VAAAAQARALGDVVREIRDSTVGALVAHGGSFLIVGQALLFYSFVLRARVALGRWPYPYHPDPKDLGFSVHHAAVWIGFTLLYISPLAVAIFYYAAAELKASVRARTLALSVYAVVCVAGVYLVLTDPGRFGEWFVD